MTYNTLFLYICNCCICYYLIERLWKGLDGHGADWQGEVGHGMVVLGSAWRGVVRCGEGLLCSVQKLYRGFCAIRKH